jgi:DNA-binding CsgD family transcriptional regulator
MRIYNYQEIARSTTEGLLKLKREIVGTGRQAGKVSSAIQNIINTINAHDQEHLWSEFETSFNETDPDYLNRLAARFPDLTPNELKLCIFLKLNLRTKEISVITQQSLKSIEVGRTRLRKKLGIDNTNTNIASFLQQV